MIEFTTGIAFLLSSMYGAGTISANTANIDSLVNNTIEEKKEVIITDSKELEQYLREHFADEPLLVEIARCESTFNHFDKEGRVLRGKVDNADVGVMQINERYHLETSKKLGFDIHTLEGNLAYARYLFEKSGSKPWNASAPCWGNTLAAK